LIQFFCAKNKSLSTPTNTAYRSRSLSTFWTPPLERTVSPIQRHPLRCKKNRPGEALSSLPVLTHSSLLVFVDCLVRVKLLINDDGLRMLLEVLKCDVFL
jgi:hypothetical protein